VRVYAAQSREALPMDIP